MLKKKSVLPYISGIGFSIIFGFSFMFSRIALKTASAFQLIGLRFSMAFLALSVLLAFKIIKINLKWKDFWTILPLAVFQPVIYFVAETYGIAGTSASLSGIFMSLIPIFTAGLSYVMLKERLNKNQILFIVLSLAGVVLISMLSFGGGQQNLTTGILFLMLAVISASFYAVLTRKLTQTYSAIEITFVMIAVGAVVFTATGLVESAIKGYDYLEPLSHPPFVIACVFLGLLSSVAAFFLMNYTGSKVSASQNVLFANLVTVVAIFAGGVFLKEKIYTYQIIGSVFIITGVWGANYFAEPLKKEQTDIPIIK